MAQWNDRPLSLAAIRKLLAKRGGSVVARNSLAEYLGILEVAIPKVVASPERCRLTNQEAFTLSAAWRKFEYDGAFVPRFDFSPSEARATAIWYDRQSRRASRETPPKYRRLIKEWRSISIDKQGKRALVFKPSEPGTPFRKFRDTESMMRFLSLPHYKEARDRIAGSVAIMSINRKGKPKKTYSEVEI